MTHESLAERVLWKKLQGKALDGYRFLRHQTIGKICCTFYCPKARLIVDLQQKESQQQAIQLQHLTVLQFTNLDVYRNRDNVLNAIKLALRARSSSVPYTDRTDTRNIPKTSSHLFDSFA